MELSFKNPLRAICCLSGMLLSLGTFAQEKSVQSKAPSSQKSTPILITYSVEGDEEVSQKSTQKGQNAVQLAQAPEGGTEVPSFAGELSASIMNEELRNRIDEEYVRNLKSFMYYHGYDSTSQDARGRFLGVDRDEEIEVRKKMASSVRSYMLSRGIPKFFLSREDTKRVGETYQKVVEATHVNVNLTTPDEENIVVPWSLASGFNPFNMKSYARVTNEFWTIEAKYNLGTIGNISRSDLRNMEFHAARKINDKYSVGNRYNLLTKMMVPYVNYVSSKFLSTQLNMDIPLGTEGMVNFVHTKVSMSYLF